MQVQLKRELALQTAGGFYSGFGGLVWDAKRARLGKSRGLDRVTLGLSSVPEDTGSRLCPVRKGARVPSMRRQGLSDAGQTQPGRVFLASCSPAFLLAFTACLLALCLHKQGFVSLRF